MKCLIKKYKLHNKRNINEHLAMWLASDYITLMKGKSVLLCGGNLAITENITMHLSLAQQFHT